MEWATLLAVILQFLGPILRDWLDSLLKRAATQMANGKAPVQYASGADAERALWSQAAGLLAMDERNLTWWQRLWGVGNRRRRAFAAARAAAERRAGQFYTSTLSGNSVMGLTPIEIEEIRSAS